MVGKSNEFFKLPGAYGSYKVLKVTGFRGLKVVLLFNISLAILKWSHYMGQGLYKKQLKRGDGVTGFFFYRFCIYLITHLRKCIVISAALEIQIRLLSLIPIKIDQIWEIDLDRRWIWYSRVGLTSDQISLMSKFGRIGAERPKSQKLFLF